MQNVSFDEADDDIMSPSTRPTDLTMVRNLQSYPYSLAFPFPSSIYARDFSRQMAHDLNWIQDISDGRIDPKDVISERLPTTDGAWHPVSSCKEYSLVFVVDRENARVWAGFSKNLFRALMDDDI